MAEVITSDAEAVDDQKVVFNFQSPATGRVISVTIDGWAHPFEAVNALLEVVKDFPDLARAVAQQVTPDEPGQTQKNFHSIMRDFAGNAAQAISQGLEIPLPPDLAQAVARHQAPQAPRDDGFLPGLYL